MKDIIWLNRNENLRQVELEEKNRFLRSILVQIGISIEDFWEPNNLNLTVEQKIKLLTILSMNQIQVIDDNDGNMFIYFENDLIAKWNKCSYKFKRDLAQKDPKKQIYLEMTIDFWSIFEEEI